MGTEPSNAMITVKVQGATPTKVIDILKPYVDQILDVREV